MGTKSNPGKWDCYANAEPDEPMFVLLARDRHAPALMLLWAILRQTEGEDAKKVNDAIDCALAAAAWARKRGRKPLTLQEAIERIVGYATAKINPDDLRGRTRRRR